MTNLRLSYRPRRCFSMSQTRRRRWRQCQKVNRLCQSQNGNSICIAMLPREAIAPAVTGAEVSAQLCASATTWSSPSLGGSNDSARKTLVFPRTITRGVQLGQVAIYCRVSTDDQSCERQERDLLAFANRAGHEIVAIFKETASGADNARPERAKVLALARATKSMPSWSPSSADGAVALRTSSRRSTISTAGRSASWPRLASASISGPPAAS